jgi:hypothetical protein
VIIRRSIIYIPLLNEGTRVWRPTEGELLDEMRFIVQPTKDYDLEEELWEFPPGSVVLCEIRTLLGAGEVLVAVKLV